MINVNYLRSILYYTGNEAKIFFSHLLGNCVVLDNLLLHCFEFPVVGFTCGLQGLEVQEASLGR